MTEKAVTNCEKSVTNSVCDRLCDQFRRSQNPWLEIEFVTDSVRNWDAICDRWCGRYLWPNLWLLSSSTPFSRRLLRWEFMSDLWPTLWPNINCDRFCDWRESHNLWPRLWLSCVATDFVTDVVNNVPFLWPYLWPILVWSKNICDWHCDRGPLWPRSFVTAFVTNFIENYASLWPFLWPILKIEE